MYLCMEMVEGENLLELILVKRGLEEARAKEVFFQLCSAVSYCHDKNVHLLSYPSSASSSPLIFLFHIVFFSLRIR